MSRLAQAFEGNCTFRQFVPSRWSLLLGLTMVSACGAGGFSLEKAEVDRSVLTSKVPDDAGSGGSDANRLSDQATIRNAVSSADLEGLAGPGDALGQCRDRLARVDHLARREQGATACSAAGSSASRESFDGVACSRAKSARPAPAPGDAGFRAGLILLRILPPLEFLPSQAHIGDRLNPSLQAGMHARPL